MSTLVFAQPIVITQLQASLDTLEDSIEKMDVLAAQVRAYGYIGKLEDTQEVLAQLKACSERINSPLGLGYYYIFRSVEEFNRGQMDASMNSVLKAQEMAQQAGSKDFQLMADYNLAEVYAWGKADYEKAIQILEAAIHRAGTAVSKKNLGNGYRSLGDFYHYLGDTTKAILYEEKALACLQGIAEDPFIDPILSKKSAQTLDNGALNIAQVKGFLGTLYGTVGKTSKAIQYMEEAYGIFQLWEAPTFSAGVLLDLGDVYLNIGDLVKALEAYRQARAMYLELDNQYYVAHTNMSLGWVFNKLNDLENATKVYLEARNIFSQKMDSIDLINSGIHLGKAYLGLEKIASAESIFQSSLEMALLMDDEIAIGQLYSNLSKIERIKGNFATSLQYLQAGQVINRRFNRTMEDPQILLNFSRLYRAWSQPDSAIHYALAAQALGQKLNMKNQLKESHLELSELYAESGLFQKAYQEHLHFFEVYEQLNTENAQQLMKAEQVKQNIETYEKEKTAAQANAQLLAQRNQLYILLTFTFLALLLLSAYLLFRLRKSRQQLALQNDKLIQLNSTKDKFFGIIAHDIRSPIVALQSVDQQIKFLLKKQRYDRLEQLATMVARTTRQLDTLLDNLLNWALLQRGMVDYRPQLVSLEERINDISQLYAGAMEAKNIQFDNNLRQDQAVLVDDAAFQTTLRNLINNAIKFTPAGGKIAVSSSIKGNQIQLSIRDTGTGIEPDHLEQLFALNKKSNKGTAGEKGTGLGLILCKELVEMNKGTIFVESELGKGSTFTFTVPRN